MMRKSFKKSALLAALSLPATAAAMPAITLTVPVTPPSMVSDGDIRVVVSSDDKLSPEAIHILVNGKRTKAKLAPDNAGLTTVIGDLRPGQNEIRAEARGFAPATLVVTNHGRGGPIFSGAQLQPWICAAPVAQAATPDQAAVDASGLSVAAIDAQCNAPSSFSYFYRTTDAACSMEAGAALPCFRPYVAGKPPADIAKVETSAGKRVDYIVRVERGAMNRGLYDLAVLYDPAAKEPAALDNWNHKIVWAFGGSGANIRRQLAPASSWMNDAALSRGFLVGVSNFTDGSRNNNRPIAAETLMMLREHVSDRYGPVRHLIGEGCSAGSMQQNIISTMYPGLIDGVLISCSFPDSDSLMQEIVDSFLLKHYFDSAVFAATNTGLSPEAVAAKRIAIAGHKDDGIVNGWARFRPGYVAGNLGAGPSSNGCQLPNALVYDAKSNPDGIRCATPDSNIAVWGAYPGTRIARHIRDNVGVQYGLGALLDGKIGAEDFLVLNANVGGLDRDGGFSSARMEGDAEAIATAYRVGLVSSGRLLGETPIIDLRGEENSNVHANWHSFATRQRIRQALGNADNYILWRVGLPTPGGPWGNAGWEKTGLPLRSLLDMDQWLDAVDADKAPGSRLERVSRNRPATLKSFCYLGTDYSREVYDEATCDKDPNLTYYSSIHQVAGGPLASNVLKCELRPVDPAEYRGRLDAAQIERLRTIFPGGVCDWSKPGVGQQDVTPWPSF